MSRALGGSWSTRRWFRWISPLDTLSRPASMRSSVDFPQPDGPSSTRNSRSGTSRLTLLTAVFVPNVRVTRSSLIDAMAVDPIFASALDAAGGHAGHHVALDEQIENDGRQRVHQADRHHRVHRRAQLADESREADRGGAQTLVADQRLREDVFVPAVEESDDRGRGERWRDQRKDDADYDIETRATIDTRRFFDVDRHAVDRTFQYPRDDRNGERAVGENQSGQRIEQRQIAEDRIERHHQHGFGQHLRDEEAESHESHAAKAKPRECVGGENGERNAQ